MGTMKYPIIDEENMKVSHNSKDAAEEEVSTSQKGGFRTIPFILAAATTQTITYSGIVTNMVLYMTNEYHMDVVTCGIILPLWAALSDYLVILAAFLADSYFGRYRTMAFGTIVNALGLSLLWLTAIIPQAKPPLCNPSNSTCQDSTFAQLALLFVSLIFISIGAGAIRPCSNALGADQLVKKEHDEKNELSRYFNWYFSSMSFSSVIGFTIIVYIQYHFGMKVGLGVPAILMLLGASLFMSASSLYVKMKPERSVFSELPGVLIVAYKNRELVLPPNNSDGLYCHGADSEFVIPSDKLRFLNKACIITSSPGDFNYDGSGTKPQELRTVEQVEALKALISIIPMWSTGIMIYTALLQSATVLQADIMDRHLISNFQIPSGSFGVFTGVSVILCIVIYSVMVVPLMGKYAGQRYGLSPKVRMGIGVVLSCVSMGTAAMVENIRRRTAIEEGLLDEPKGVVTMSALWLIPQSCLSGIAEGFSFVGQTEYYFAHLPKDMSTLAVSLFILGTAVGGTLGSIMVAVVNRATKSRGDESWFSNNLNKGHYDYYYALLSFLSLLNFVYFLSCCGAFGHKKNSKGSFANEREDLKETLLMNSGELTST